MRLVFVFFTLALLTMVTYGQREKSALLKGEEAKKLAKQCSRPSPSEFTNVWEPSQEQISAMEAKLSEISKLIANGCCIKGAQVEKPEAWYLQYAALLWKGRKIIYLHGFSRSQPTDFSCETKSGKLICTEGPNSDWKTNAYMICDGGTSWGVIYDVADRKFSDLAVNGV